MSFFSSVQSFFQWGTSSSKDDPKRGPTLPRHVSVPTPFGSYFHSNSKTSPLSSLSSNIPSPRQSLYSGYSPRPSSVLLDKDIGIQLQDFSEAGKSAQLPTVEESWNRIRTWCEHEYPELYDTINYPALEQDIYEFETTMGYSLPPDVRESYYIYNGQETDSTSFPSGLFFGVALLSLEEILTEWEIWRQVASEYGSSFIDQRAKPLGAIKECYANLNWIPLCKDFAGNNIAIDMDPGPKGTVGQVIIFGRDIDTKYVVAQSWRAFLARFVFDLDARNWVIDENGTLLAKFKENSNDDDDDGMTPIDYFEYARLRCEGEYNNMSARAKEKRPLLSVRSGDDEMVVKDSSLSISRSISTNSNLLSPVHSPHSHLPRGHTKRQMNINTNMIQSSSSSIASPLSSGHTNDIPITLKDAEAIIKRNREIGLCSPVNSSQSSIVMIADEDEGDTTFSRNRITKDQRIDNWSNSVEEEITTEEAQVASPTLNEYPISRNIDRRGTIRANEVNARNIHSSK